MSTPAPRLPYEPLENYIALHWPMADSPSAAGCEKGRPSTRRIAHLCGGLTSVWRREGLTVQAADRAAVALGAHPLDIWPDFHDDLLEREA